MSRGSDHAVEHLRLTVSGAGDLVVQLPAGGGGQPAAAVYPLPAQRASETAFGGRRFEVVVDGWRFEVVAEPAQLAALREKARRAAAEHQSAVVSLLRAQIPGRVTRVFVAAGDQVEQGQRLLAIEAMKMENEIRAPRGGTVRDVAVAEGGLVELGDNLLSIE